MTTPRSTWPSYPEDLDQDLAVFLEAVKSAIQNPDDYGSAGNHTIASGTAIGSSHNTPALSIGDVLVAYGTAVNEVRFQALTFAQLSGSIADGQVPESAVTQHEAALTIVDGQIAESSVTQHEAALTIVDGQIAESSVTQHEAALTIVATQVTAGAFPDAYTITGALTLSSWLDITGAIAIGDAGAITADRLLDLDGSLSGGGTIYGAVYTPSAGAASALAVGIYMRMDTDVGAFTVDEISQMRVANVGKGAGTTITKQVGLYIEDQTQGGTNLAIQTNSGKVLFGDEVEMDADLNHDGTNVGLYGAAPVAQAADIGALTLTTHSGAPNTTLVDVAGSGDDATINDNLHELGLQINALRTLLRNLGPMA